MSELVETPEPYFTSFLADIKKKFVEYERFNEDHLANVMKIIEDNFDELFPNGCDFILDEFKVRDLNFVSDIGSFNIRINECYLIIADKFNIET